MSHACTQSTCSISRAHRFYSLVCLLIALGVLLPSGALGQTVSFTEDFESITSTATEITSPMEREAGTYQTTATVPGWMQVGQPSQFIKINGVSGNTALVLNEFGDTPNTLSREIPGLIPGATYRFTFQYWGDNCGPCGYSFDWEINGEVFSISEGSFQTDSGNFHTVTHEFAASSSSTIVRFSETSTSSGSPVFDNILLEELEPVSVTELTPIAYYPLDGSGEEATGNNIDLNPIGAPVYVSSLAPGLGQALSTDGVDDALIGAGYNPSATGELTLSAWVRAQTRASWGTVFKNWSSGTNGQFHFGLDSSNGALSNYITVVGGSGTPRVVSPTQFPTGVWTHVAVVVNSTALTQKLYIDGALVRTSPFTGTLVGSPCAGLGIAVKPECDGLGPAVAAPGYWHGELDEVAAWDSPLSDAQIAELYDLGIAGTPLIVFNQPPIADAGVGFEVAVGERVTVSGGASSDDSTPTNELQFSWLAFSVPQGSLGEIQNADQSHAQLIPDLPGEYVLQLTVTDEVGAVSAPAYVTLLADIQPGWVFSTILEGGAYSLSRPGFSTSERDLLLTLDFDQGQAAFLRYTRSSIRDYENNIYSNLQSDALSRFDGGALMNLATSGDTGPNGEVFRSFGYATILSSAAIRFGAKVGYSDWGIFDLTTSGVTRVDESLVGFRPSWDTRGGAIDLSLILGRSSHCLETRTRSFNGQVYEYCSRYKVGVYTLSDGQLSLLFDNESIFGPEGQAFMNFNNVRELSPGTFAFIGGYYVDASQSAFHRELFLYDGSTAALRVLPVDAEGNPSYSVDYVEWDGHSIIFSGYDRSSDTDGLFQWTDGFASDLYTSRTGRPVRPEYYHRLQVEDRAMVFNGSRKSRVNSQRGAYWMENDIVHGIALDGDEINDVQYDRVFIDSNRAVRAIDGRSVILKGYRYLLNEYDASIGTREYLTDIHTIRAQFDTDRDKIGDDSDNCPNRPNPAQEDLNGNDIGDLCEDSDADSWLDADDNCPLVANTTQSNADADNYGDACDLCPLLAGASQSDIDHDGIGDDCDLDKDGDGVDDEFDNCPFIANAQTDLDSDGEGDDCDSDIDGDGIANIIDGLFVAGAFLDQSEEPSTEFTDEHLGGGSFGRVVNAGGLGLSIEDAADPDAGVLVSAPTGNGTARLKQCDYRGRDANVEILQGGLVEITCGSIQLRSLYNTAFLTLDDDVVIAVPNSTSAKVLDTTTTDFTVTTELEGTLPVTVFMGTDLQMSLVGESIANVHQTAEDHFNIENGTSSTDPIQVTLLGEQITYAPGQHGQPVSIDIKPGSDDNAINLGSNGVVPVAIVGSDGFDATDIDPLTVELASSEVRLRGRGTPSASVSDVNDDGFDDLVVQVATENLVLQPTDSTAKLTGTTYSGVEFIGQDVVTIVPAD